MTSKTALTHNVTYNPWKAYIKNPEPVIFLGIVKFLTISLETT